MARLAPPGRKQCYPAMNIFEYSVAARPRSLTTRWALPLICLLSLTLGFLPCEARQPDYEFPGAEVQTRGPVHEAFAEMVDYNPEPGIIVNRAPPPMIEEMPPAERPEGANITWIPGYWAWDDDRNDFMWISGTWRALPPGREWVAGYWAQTGQGYQWISGYWAEATATNTTYLPPPPNSLDAGPTTAAPSLDYVWAPGSWVWISGRYAWRPGYWVRGRTDWDWTPAHYVWTPRGSIFVEGFWDYPIERRGALFAPVYFASSWHARPNRIFSPRIVINPGVFSDHLFLRPRYHHYYFGDYYAPHYVQSGFYSPFSYHSARVGYNPIYARQMWVHRTDRDWARRSEADYQRRRDHDNERPPRTWSDQRGFRSGPQNRAIGAPLDEWARRRDNNVRVQVVAERERQQLARRNQDVQKYREQRRTLESPGANVGRRSETEAVRVNAVRSPIVAPPTGRFRGNPRPPKAPRLPTPDASIQPRFGAPPAPGVAPRAIPPEARLIERPQPAPRLETPAPARSVRTLPERRVEVAPVVPPTSAPIRPPNATPGPVFRSNPSLRPNPGLPPSNGRALGIQEHRMPATQSTVRTNLPSRGIPRAIRESHRVDKQGRPLPPEDPKKR